MNPDSATRGAPHPDTGTPGAGKLDSSTPDLAYPNPDTAIPIRPVDAGTADAEIPRADTSPPSPLDAGDSASSRPPVGPTVITVTPPAVDLGAVDPGTTSSPATVTVTNAGTTVSGPLNVSVKGAGIIASGCSGVVLAPNETCQISISAGPTVPGPISGVVEVGDSPENIKKIAVSGISTGGPSRSSLSPNPLDLGPVLTGRTVTGTVVLTNTSATGLPGIVMNVSGVGFTLSPTGTCTDALPVGQSCNIVVSFTAGPTSGPAKGSVSVSQGGVTKTVSVTAIVQAPAKLVMTPPTAAFQAVVGTPSSPFTFHVANVGDVSSAIPLVTITANPTMLGITAIAVPAAKLAINPSALDFGTVPVSQESAPLTLTVTNTGGVPTGDLKVEKSGMPFTIKGDTCRNIPLPNQATCHIVVTFTPTAATEATGSVSVSTPASASTITATLHGSGG